MTNTRSAYATRSPQPWPDVELRRRAVMVLRDEKKSLREIATVLGISYMTVQRDIRHMTLVEAQLSLFGVFADKGKIVVGQEARVWSIDDWTREQHVALYRRYRHNEQASGCEG